MGIFVSVALLLFGIWILMVAMQTSENSAPQSTPPNRQELVRTVGILAMVAASIVFMGMGSDLFHASRG